jgi:hypothetical protein
MRSLISIQEAAHQADADRTLAGGYQSAINQFLDDFREASPARRMVLIADPPEVRDGRLAALLAGVVHALCDETGSPYPTWLATVGVRSPRPFDVMRPDGPYPDDYLAEQRLDTPPWFASRDVLVPSNYLNRA